MPVTISRPANPKSSGTAVGIDEPLIRAVVETFDGGVRRDKLLAPIFAHPRVC